MYDYIDNEQDGDGSQKGWGLTIVLGAMALTSAALFWVLL